MITRILLLTAFAINLFALSQDDIAQMVTQNPELLNSPEAKAYLESHQGSIQQTTIRPGMESNIPKVKNDIDNLQNESSHYSNNKKVSTDRYQQSTYIQHDNPNINIEESPSIKTNKSDENQLRNYTTTNIFDDSTDDGTDITDDEMLVNKKLNENIQKDGSLRLTPLRYKSDNEEIRRIKSNQVHLKKKKYLNRFSAGFFRNKNRILQQNIQAPTGYTLNRGDTLDFWIYGGSKEKKFSLKVNSEGNIDIPEVGPVRVAGEQFGEVKRLLTNYLSSSYKNSHVVVTLKAFSNAQVTVTGFVNAPGIYNTTSVSTVKDILIEAGGVSDIGSVRSIEILRGGTVVESIDYYSLIANGLDHGDFMLKPGDVIHIPRAYGLVSIEGQAYREAIYEFKEGETLYDIFQYAGGVRPNADGTSILIKRYSHNTLIKNLTISINQAQTFTLRAGDEIYIQPLNATQDNYILLTGNVVREGKRAITGNRMRLSTFLKKELNGRGLNSLFLENTRLDYALIKRIDKDLKPRVYKLNLKNILDRKNDFILRNRDELYIFNRLDTGTAPFVTIDGAPVIKVGKYIYNKGMTIIDLINQAGIKQPYDKSKVKITSTQNQNGEVNVDVIDIKRYPNYPLKERDSVTLFDLNDTHPLHSATITGEVVKPGIYPISQGMTLQEFLEGAGGLTPKAYKKNLEIIRYNINENGDRVKKILNVPLHDASAFVIKEFDEINIKRTPSWNKRETITLTGEVRFPGTYVVHSGEKLSSVIERAGGFTQQAFLYGAVFTRESIKKLQKEALQKELSKLKEQVIVINIRNSSVGKNSSSISAIVQAVDSLIAEANKFEPKGRITIALNDDIEAFRGSQSDLTLQSGDKLHIPSYNDTVVINGEVMMPTAVTYSSQDIDYYLKRSGDLTALADNEHIYVIHANGEARKVNTGSFLFGGGDDVCIKKGDVITVPKKFYYDTRTMDLTKDIADIMYKISLTIAAAHTVGAI